MNKVIATSCGSESFWESNQVLQKQSRWMRRRKNPPVKPKTDLWSQNMFLRSMGGITEAARHSLPSLPSLTFTHKCCMLLLVTWCVPIFSFRVTGFVPLKCIIQEKWKEADKLILICFVFFLCQCFLKTVSNIWWEGKTDEYFIS